MKITEFVNQVLIKEMGEITHTHQYLSFGLISQGIELLGACFDQYEFHEKYHSADRFNEGMKLFDQKYHNFANNNAKENLYSNLRCGMLHVILPTSEFALSQRGYGYSNLQKAILSDGSYRYVLIAEDFYDDFNLACRELIRLIETGNILNFPKVNSAPTAKREILKLKRDFVNVHL
jgi:hypothetical protein